MMLKAQRSSSCAASQRGQLPQDNTHELLIAKFAVLRDTLHRLTSQLDEEGLDVPFPRIQSEAVYALNVLTSVNGCSPCAAVLGRVPALLPSEDIVLSDGVPEATSSHSHRLREIAVQAIAEGTAKERMQRALRSHTRPAGHELDYKVGDQIDY